MPDDFERMWSDLAPLGRSSVSGGYFRQPFTSVDGELRSWFIEQPVGGRIAARIGAVC
jgi:beta-ureidopropionase / N-carbamoyl-L-amino-acid hydrolase